MSSDKPHLDRGIGTQLRDEAMAKSVAQQPTPRDFLEGLRADFASSAASKEQEANDVENHLMFLRAEAAGLRHAAVGVQEAIDLLCRETARAKEFIEVRDGKDQPLREMPVNPREAQAERAQGRW